MYPHKCFECGESFVTCRSWQRFCSKKCNTEYYRKTNYPDGNSQYKRLGIPTGSVGAISELIACYDLLKRGYQVFRAVSPHSHCDVVAYRNGKPERIEVRTAYKNKAGKLIYPGTKHTGRYDYLALVVGTEVTYIPDLPE